MVLTTVIPERSDSAPLQPYNGSDLEPGIARVVHLLREWGIDTYYSCQGGETHSCGNPTVLFRGDEHQAFQALALLYGSGYRVHELRKVWQLWGLELHAIPRPTWHLTLCSAPLSPAMASRAQEDAISLQRAGDTRTAETT